MKKYVLTGLGILTVLVINAQTPTNTFPDDGNKGIGIINPTEKLEVIGNIKAQKGIIDGSNGRLLEIGRLTTVGKRNIFF